MPRKYRPRGYKSFSWLKIKAEYNRIILYRVEITIDHVQYSRDYEIVGFDVARKKVRVKPYNKEEETWTMTKVNECEFCFIPIESKSDDESFAYFPAEHPCEDDIESFIER